jgi:hypothetical protein
MDAFGHFHGGNRGSNPLGDANKINVLLNLVSVFNTIPAGPVRHGGLSGPAPA